MKKTLLTFLGLACISAPLLAADLAVETTATASDTPTLSLTTTDAQASFQQPFQQLISYAVEVSSIALENKKQIGRYTCENIYSSEGYDALPDYPCELIVHSKKGPIVVRYKNVTPKIEEQIKTFLIENDLGSSLYYNNGRFRFSMDEEKEETEDTLEQ